MLTQLARECSASGLAAEAHACMEAAAGVAGVGAAGAAARVELGDALAAEEYEAAQTCHHSALCMAVPPQQQQAVQREMLELSLLAGH